LLFHWLCKIKSFSNGNEDKNWVEKNLDSTEEFSDFSSSKIHPENSFLICDSKELKQIFPFYIHRKSFYGVSRKRIFYRNLTFFALKKHWNLQRKNQHVTMQRSKKWLQAETQITDVILSLTLTLLQLTLKLRTRFLFRFCESNFFITLNTQTEKFVFYFKTTRIELIPARILMLYNSLYFYLILSVRIKTWHLFLRGRTLRISYCQRSIF
jgi:hypothetical protein